MLGSKGPRSNTALWRSCSSDTSLRRNISVTSNAIAVSVRDCLDFVTCLRIDCAFDQPQHCSLTWKKQTD